LTPQARNVVAEIINGENPLDPNGDLARAVESVDEESFVLSAAVQYSDRLALYMKKLDVMHKEMIA
jgi:hypothetical protein